MAQAVVDEGSNNSDEPGARVPRTEQQSLVSNESQELALGKALERLLTPS